MAIAALILGIFALITMIVGMILGISLADVYHFSSLQSYHDTAVASLVLLIISIVIGIAAIVLSAIGLKKPGKKPMKIIGLVFGIVSVTLSSIILIACIVVAGKL